MDLKTKVKGTLSCKAGLPWELTTFLSISFLLYEPEG